MAKTKVNYMEKLIKVINIPRAILPVRRLGGKHEKAYISFTPFVPYYHHVHYRQLGRTFFDFTKSRD